MYLYIQHFLPPLNISLIWHAHTDHAAMGLYTLARSLSHPTNDH